MELERFAGLPGYEWIRDGVADLDRGETTIAALLVSMVAKRLRAIGIDVPGAIPNPERRLYDLLHAKDQDSAHSRYNALTRRLTSFAQAAECADLTEGGATLATLSPEVRTALESFEREALRRAALIE